MHSYASTDIFNQIFTNECYMKYMDRYKYVSVADNDETVIPRLIERLFRIEDNFNFVRSLNVSLTNTYESLDTQLSELNCDKYQNGSNLVGYIDEVGALNQFKEPKAFYFQQGYYLDNGLMNLVLIAIEKFLNGTMLGYFKKLIKKCQ